MNGSIIYYLDIYSLIVLQCYYHCTSHCGLSSIMYAIETVGGSNWPMEAPSLDLEKERTYRLIVVEIVSVSLH